MVAQPIPASINTGYMINSGVLGVIKLPIKNADARIIIPPRIVFLLPIRDEMIPTGI